MADEVKNSGPHKKTRAERDYDKAVFSTITEFLFIILPFVVALIVFAYRGTVGHIIYLPEWGIAATVLQGQALVKFISSLLIGGRDYRFGGKNTIKLVMESMQPIVAVLIVLFFAPTLVILCFVLLEEELSIKLAIAQLTSFAIAIVIFGVFGTISEIIILGHYRMK